MKTDQLPVNTKTIRYEETDLTSLISTPHHFRYGIYLICTWEGAIVSTGAQKYIFNGQTELIFLTGSLLQVFGTSGDLQVRMLMSPKEAFLDAALPVNTPHLSYTHEHPYYRHIADERGQKIWRQTSLWIDMAQMLLTESMPQFRGQQEHNSLQSLLTWLSNMISEELAINKQYSRA